MKNILSMLHNVSFFHLLKYSIDILDIIISNIKVKMKLLIKFLVVGVAPQTLVIQEKLYYETCLLKSINLIFWVIISSSSTAIGGDHNFKENNNKGIVRDFIKEIDFLYEQKIINVKPLVSSQHEQIFSAGMVDYNFSKNTCHIILNQDLYQKSNFKSYWRKKFFIYHEVAHCYFFEEVPILFADKSLEPEENKILSDFFYLEFLKPLSIEGLKFTGYNYLQEVYADIFALILIYQQGVPIDLIKTIIKERDNYFDPVHQSDISLKIFNKDLDHLNNKQIQDLAIQLSSEKALNFYCKNYFYQEIDFRDIFLTNLTFAKTQQILLDKFQIYTKDDREFYKRISFIQDGDILNKNYEFFLTISKNWKKEEKEFKQAIIGGRYGNDWSEKTKNINIFLKKRCQ